MQADAQSVVVADGIPPDSLSSSGWAVSLPESRSDFLLRVLADRNGCKTLIEKLFAKLKSMAQTVLTGKVRAL